MPGVTVELTRAVREFTRPGLATAAVSVVDAELKRADAERYAI